MCLMCFVVLVLCLFKPTTPILLFLRTFSYMLGGSFSFDMIPVPLVGAVHVMFVVVLLFESW